MCIVTTLVCIAKYASLSKYLLYFLEFLVLAAGTVPALNPFLALLGIFLRYFKILFTTVSKAWV